MEALAWWVSVAGFAVAMLATPGPNNAMLAASGASFGLARTLPHLVGVALGFAVMLLLVALGAAELLRAAPALERAMRWVGAAWLLVIAWRIAMAVPAAPGEDRARGRPMTFVEAALFQWVNPKAWMIAAAGSAAYAAEGGWAAPAALALVFLVTGLASSAAWAALGAGLARLLLRPVGLRWFNRAMAALLVVSVLPLLAG